MILTAAVIGLLCYFLGEAKQRRAFLEAKQSLEVKMLIEEQSAEQVSLRCFNYNLTYLRNVFFFRFVFVLIWFKLIIRL